ncbi:uncharacterized protein TNCV_2630931 [Trichonephila clavipes]|nr:uncharacterized protein TNCV_2630931 [Trichonephila clavipes]
MDSQCPSGQPKPLDRCLSSGHYRNSTLGLLATDHVILNHGQVTWTTPELAPPLLTTTPHQREDVSALGRFNVHRCPTRRVFSDAGLELVTRQATVRYLYHWVSAATERKGNIQAYAGLGSNPGKDMVVCKCIVTSRHGSTLNSRRAASPRVRLGEREERGQIRGHVPAMEEPEMTYPKLLLYADEHYLAGKLPLLGKAWPPDHYTSCAGSVILTAHREPPHPYTVIICPQTNRDSCKHSILPICDIPHWSGLHHCRRSSCRCSGGKRECLKGHLDLRFASARYLEIVCGTIATPTSTRIVE